MQAGSFVVAKRYLCKLPRNGLESAKPTSDPPGSPCFSLWIARHVATLLLCNVGRISEWRIRHDRAKRLL
jgi:hypothetical protein